MRKGLFRQEAIDHQAHATLGKLLMIPRPLYVIIVGLIALWVVLVLVFLNTNQYQRKTSIQGWLEPTDGIFKLYSEPRRGKVKRLFVQEGESVKQGDPLVQIDYGQFDDTGLRVDTQLLQELNTKYDRTLNNIKRLSALHLSELDDLENTIVRNRTVQTELQEIASLTKRQWEVSQVHFNRAQSLLNKGFTTESDVENHQLQLLSAKQHYVRAQQELRNVKADIVNNERKLLTLPNRHANERSLLEDSLSDLKQQIITQKRNATQTIYAPQDGIVSGLQVKPGNTTHSAALLLSILPEHSEILARIVVPVRSSGFVEKGHSLHIRYDAFPFQKFGLQHGTIANVSQNLVLPGEVIDPPVAIVEPAYLATATLDSSSIAAYGKQITLKAGMTFSADVQLSDRTLMEWLLEPLYSVKGSME